MALRPNWGAAGLIWHDPDLEQGGWLILQIILRIANAAACAHDLDVASRRAAFIAKALGDIARAQGMTQVAKDSGLSRESLYKALSGERSPSFDTILKVVTALGLKLSASVKSEVEVT
jgi:probable addiction module antidote protein